MQLNVFIYILVSFQASSNRRETEHLMCRNGVHILQSIVFSQAWVL